MSYILDALKKADKERRRGLSPDVTAIHDAPPVKGRGFHPVWVGLLLAALILNAGVLAWWLGPWNAKRPQMTVRNAEEPTAVTSGGKAADIPSERVDVKSVAAGQVETGLAGGTVANRSSEKSPPPKKRETTGESRGQPKKVDVGVERSLPAGTGTVSDVKESGVVTAVLPSPAPNRIYAVHQLPPSVSKGLPNLTMSLHYFTDDPSSRIISINGKTLKEGEEVVPGLRLEKITAAGAILEYRGYRFSIGIQSG